MRAALAAFLLALSALLATPADGQKSADTLRRQLNFTAFPDELPRFFLASWK